MTDGPDRTQCQPLQVLPLEPAPCLDLRHLHGCHPWCFDLARLQDRCMQNCLMTAETKALREDENGTNGLQGKYELRGKRKGDTISEW